MSKKTFLAWVVIGVLLIIGFVLMQRLAPHTISNAPVMPATKAVLGEQTKHTGCQVQGALPDRACTPGAAMANVSTEQICTKGYASSVRDVSAATKRQVFDEYGIVDHPTGSYEVDHLVSLELGGSNDIANLWPEAAQPVPGFHEKDKIENYLHSQVCDGRMSLADAQQAIASNWLAVFQALR